MMFSFLCYKTREEKRTLLCFLGALGQFVGVHRFSCSICNSPLSRRGGLCFRIFVWERPAGRVAVPTLSAFREREEEEELAHHRTASS